MIDNVSLAGSDAVVLQLMTLPDKLRTKIEKDAVAAATKILVDRERSGAPSDSGALKKSIGTKVRRYAEETEEDKNKRIANELQALVGRWR